MYAIEKNVPLTIRVRQPYRYPLINMEVDDSFFVPDGEANIRTIRSRCSQVARNTGNQFVVRVVDGGIRVWRVK